MLVASGLTRKQAALRLGVSVSAVHNRLSRAYDKLGTTNQQFLADVRRVGAEKALRVLEDQSEPRVTPLIEAEWYGYIAAFRTYVEARRAGDGDLADQARLLMGWFGADLLPDTAGAHDLGRVGAPPFGRAWMRGLLDMLDI